MPSPGQKTKATSLAARRKQKLDQLANPRQAFTRQNARQMEKFFHGLCGAQQTRILTRHNQQGQGPIMLGDNFHDVASILTRTVQFTENGHRPAYLQ